MAQDLAHEDDLTPLQQRGQELIDRLRIGDDTPPPQTPRSSMPRIGVALGGGSARGLTHIPFIEAMDELGLKPSTIAGTSIGALIGSGWANGMTGKELREHAMNVLGTMRTIAGRTILERVIARLAPQCDGLIINANGDPARFASFGLPVVADSVADFPGPLAGILAALASPRRREILRLVWDGELSAGEIHRAMPDVTFPAVSLQLKALLAAGLVEGRSESRQRFYRARREALGELGDMLERMWNDALWNLKLQAELEETRRGPRRRRASARSKKAGKR